MKIYKFLWLAATALTLQAPANAMINGTPAVPGAWPASVVLNANGTVVSATLVGPRALLTAAFVVGARGGRYPFSVGAEHYEATCTRYPMYPEIDVNIALCLVDRDVTETTFENVAVSADWAPIGAGVTMVGYGEPSAEAPFDGVLRQGNTVIVAERGFEFVTLRGATGTYADAGGAAYIVRENGRAIAGVMSRSNLKDRTQFVRTSSESVVRFFESWSAKNRAPICGIDPAATHCGSGTLNAPSSFKLENAVASVHVQLKPEFVASLVAIRDALEKALLSFL